MAATDSPYPTLKEYACRINVRGTTTEAATAQSAPSPWPKEPEVRAEDTAANGDSAERDVRER